VLWDLTFAAYRKNRSYPAKSQRGARRVKESACTLRLCGSAGEKELSRRGAEVQRREREREEICIFAALLGVFATWREKILSGKAAKGTRRVKTINSNLPEW
jgi:hypothetical protein